MRPQGERVLRRERRNAWKGFPRGRRSTRQAETTHGKGQQMREQQAEFSAFCAQRRDMAATAGGRASAP